MAFDIRRITDTARADEVIEYLISNHMSLLQNCLGDCDCVDALRDRLRRTRLGLLYVGSGGNFLANLTALSWGGGP